MANGSNAARRKRALADHKHKKDVRKQKQHLQAIKSEAAIKQIRLASRHPQPKHHKKHDRRKPFYERGAARVEHQLLERMFW